MTDKDVEYGKLYDSIFIQTVDNKIAVHRVNSERPEVNKIVWYKDFSELPEELQQTVSVLDMHEENELIIGKGTRFDGGYMALVSVDFKLEGGHAFDDA